MNTKRRLWIIVTPLAGAFGLLFLWVVFLGNCQGRYDHFNPSVFRLSSPKYSYVPGEEVVLNFEVGGYGRFRAYKDRHKSLDLCLRTAIGDRPDFSDVDFCRSGLTSKKDEIEFIETSAEKVFHVAVTGQIVKEEDGIVFDFGEFGRFKKSKAGRFMAWGSWRVVNSPPGHPVEESTNLIYIEVTID